MRRRRTSSQSSFDLFLDTVCNTFGGILFIAILIAIQIRQTHDLSESRPETCSSEEIAEIQQKAEDIAAEIESAKVLSETIRKTMPEPVNEEERNLVEIYAKLTETKNKSVTKKSELINKYLIIVHTNTTLENEFKNIEEQLRQLEEKINKTEAVLQETNDKQKNLEHQIAVLKSNVDGLSGQVAQKEERNKNKPQKQTREEKTSITLLHDSGSKHEEIIAIRYGKFYLVQDRSQFTDIGDAVGRPKQNKGISLQDGKKCEKAINDILRNFPSSTTYICVIIYGDSFDRFYVIRDILKSNGFEYRIIPSNDTDRWYKGGSGGQVQ